jgi:hypothetical protein
MAEAKGDDAVLATIEKLVAEEHALYERQNPNEEDLARLRSINVRLDQCWDLLRQRRALREYGRDPEEAELRPPTVVENYKG